mgnify:CR=1 FL=1
MAFAEVGSGSQRATARTSSTVASLNCAFPANVVSGNLLVVGGTTIGGNVTVTDSLGTSYTVYQGTSGGVTTFVAFGIAPSSGANTVTVTPTSTSYVSYSINEFSGEDATPYDDDSTPVAAGTSTTPSDALVTTAAGGLVVGVVYKAGTATITPGSGYTTIGEEEDDNTYIAHSFIFQIVGAATTYNVDWTLGSSVAWVCLGVSFKAAAGGGTAYSLTAAQGSFALSGQTAALKAGRKVTAAQGSFAETGQAAAMQIARRLTSAVGSFALSGQNALFPVARKVTAAQGSFALSGQTAALLKGKTITGAVGSFSLTGQSAVFAAARRMTASQGSFALSGQTAALIQARLMQAANGSFTLTGQAAAMRRALRMQAAYGSFVFTGQSATLTGPSSDAVVLTHPLSFTIRSGRTYIDIASGKTEIEIESGRKTIDIG